MAASSFARVRIVPVLHAGATVATWDAGFKGVVVVVNLGGPKYSGRHRDRQMPQEPKCCPEARSGEDRANGRADTNVRENGNRASARYDQVLRTTCDRLGKPSVAVLPSRPAKCRQGFTYPLVPATAAKLPAAISSLKLLYTLARGPAELSLRPRFRLARENKSSIHLSTVAASV